MVSHDNEERSVAIVDTILDQGANAAVDLLLDTHGVTNSKAARMEKPRLRERDPVDAMGVKEALKNLQGRFNPGGTLAPNSALRRIWVDNHSTISHIYIPSV
jgi:hypothetical protein